MCFFQISEFSNNKGLSYDIISGCKEILRVRQVILKLMQKCEGISKKMETVVSCLTKKTEVEDSDDEAIQITKQPQYLSPKYGQFDSLCIYIKEEKIHACIDKLSLFCVIAIGYPPVFYCM